MAALDSELDRIEVGTARGFRHPDLFKAACKMGNLIGGGHLVRHTVEPRLVYMAVRLGLPTSDAARTVKRGIDRGMTTPRSPGKHTVEAKDRGDTVTMWMRWWDSLDQSDFPGTKGTTDLKTCAAVAMLGVTHGGPVDVGASYRQIAEFSGNALSTVTEQLKPGGRLMTHVRCTSRLKKNQWCTGKLESSRWAPEEMCTFSVQPTSLVIRERLVCTERVHLTDPGQNRWHRAGNAWRIASLLDPEIDVTVAEMATMTGLNPTTVRRRLAMLAASGGAVRVDRTTWRGGIVDATADKVSADGVDHLALKKARHELERLAWAQKKAEKIAGMYEPKLVTPTAAATVVHGAPHDVFIDAVTGEIVQAKLATNRRRVA